MSAMPSANSGCRILAVTALYKQAPSESHTLSTFFKILTENPNLAGDFSLLVYDNSPERHEIAADFALDYVHDPANGGLATAYNYALARAEQTGCEWLLLLDQDTTLTSGFFSELVACASGLQSQDQVAAIVPKLMVRGIMQSPAEHFIDYLRHQFTGPLATFDQDFSGVPARRISAYNSGSTLRVSAVRSIGGFPADFWLDYLDHAVFHELATSGWKVYVLRAVLMHELAESDLNSRPLWRFRSALKAQSLFVKRAGNCSDRLLYRLWLLRSIRRLSADCVDPRVWRETARQALFFTGRDSSAPVRPPAGN